MHDLLYRFILKIHDVSTKTTPSNNDKFNIFMYLNTG